MPRREDLTQRCAVEGCDGGVYNVANGWCNKHYVRYWRTGSLELKPRPLRSDLSYAGAHGRVRRELGNANLNPCVDCGAPATDWAYDRTDPDESVGFQKGRHRVVYSQWPEFYKPLCHRCHALLDQGAVSASRTHCTRGHALSDENVYTPPGTRGRSCRVCLKEANRRWRIKNGHPDPALNPRRSSTGHKNVAKQGKGFRAVITIRGERFIGPTRATPELAAEDRDAFIARKKKEEGERMNLNTVRVYSTPSCVQCMLTKKWFNDRDISFDEVDLTESEDDYRAVLALGYKAAPIVMVAPDVHWGGFRVDLLELHFGEKKAA